MPLNDSLESFLLQTYPRPLCLLPTLDLSSGTESPGDRHGLSLPGWMQLPWVGFLLCLTVVGAPMDPASGLAPKASSEMSSSAELSNPEEVVVYSPVLLFPLPERSNMRGLGAWNPRIEDMPL